MMQDTAHIPAPEDLQLRSNTPLLANQELKSLACHVGTITAGAQVFRELDLQEHDWSIETHQWSQCI